MLTSTSYRDFFYFFGIIVCLTLFLGILYLLAVFASISFEIQFEAFNHVLRLG